MNDQPAPSGKFNPMRWVKKNKIAATIIGGAGLLFFLTKKGQGGGGPAIYDETGEDTGASAIQLVPVSASPSEGTFEEQRWSDDSQRLTEEIDRLREEAAEGDEQVKKEMEEKEREWQEQQQPEMPDPPDPGPTPVANGISLHGRNFPAAIRVINRRDGKSERGKYIEYVLQFPGFTQRWHYYTEKPTGWKKVGDSRETGNPSVNAGTGNGGGGSAAPVQAAPKGCAHAAEIQKNRNEISRLQKEIEGLQAKISNLTANLQNHPKAAKRGQWEQERNQARGAINHKRDEVTRFSNRNNSLRSQPGCGGA